MTNTKSLAEQVARIRSRIRCPERIYFTNEQCVGIEGHRLSSAIRGGGLPVGYPHFNSSSLEAAWNREALLLARIDELEREVEE